MQDKTDYIAPVSLWLVVRKRFFASSGIFIEPAWTGTPAQSGPVIFVSRMLAEVFASLRNKHHAADDSDGWKVIPLSGFDLLAHARGVTGPLHCMMTFGLSMFDSESVIVAIGAPCVRYVPLSFTVSEEDQSTTFHFSQWAFDFFNEEWASLGLADFENDLEAADNMDKTTFDRAAKVAVASLKVHKNPKAETSGVWGVYATQSDKWVIGEVRKDGFDKTVHQAGLRNPTLKALGS